MKLGDLAQHTRCEPAAAGLQVEVLGHAVEDGPGCLQLGDEVVLDSGASGQPVDLPHQYHLQPLGLNVPPQALELRPLLLAARQRLIDVGVVDRPALPLGVGPAVSELRVDRGVVALPLAADPGIDPNVNRFRHTSPVLGGFVIGK
ncbi:MAG TPA: hypothetical protein VGE07_18805 [Herpetosiphonaceae bacterium]